MMVICSHRLILTVIIIFTSDIAFEELKQKLDDRQVTLIDVRMPGEHRKDGMIPNSKNLARESCSCLIRYTVFFYLDTPVSPD